MKSFFSAVMISMLIACNGHDLSQKAEMPKVTSLTAKQQQMLVSWIKQRYQDPFDEGPIRFKGSAVDLNADGQDEIVARLENREFCGSGGCLLVVLRSDDGQYEAAGNITLSFLPVYIFPTKTKNWFDLGVSVRRDYVSSGVSKLPFDGQHYAENPTLPPASAALVTEGKVMIADKSEEAAK